MSSAIKAVLFDCDGVLQHPRNDWRADLAALTGLSGDEFEGFLTDLDVADRSVSAGSTTFTVAAAPVLARWAPDVSPERLLSVFFDIEVDPAMLDGVRGLLAHGFACGLGTNQHHERAVYMREHLDYDQLFDPIVISCEIGLAKPQVEYFAYAVAAFGLEPGEVLFMDDVLANVEGARAAGLVAEHFAHDAGRPELDRILALHGLVDPVPA